MCKPNKLQGHTLVITVPVKSLAKNHPPFDPRARKTIMVRWGTIRQGTTGGRSTQYVDLLVPACATLSSAKQARCSYSKHSLTVKVRSARVTPKQTNACGIWSYSTWPIRTCSIFEPTLRVGTSSWSFTLGSNIGNEQKRDELHSSSSSLWNGRTVLLADTRRYISTLRTGTLQINASTCSPP